MCGITGFVDFKRSTSEECLNLMIGSLSHRGPDDRGAEIFQYENCSAGLGQARLSIIDVSSLGHQPMNYKNFTVVFNGEIYNFFQIRQKLMLLGHQFISHSDTEVILHAYEEWGREAVTDFIGMFVIVLLDHEKKELVIFRDRAGVKPFYYYFKNGLFLFASELKAFHKHPHFEKAIDERSLLSYFELGYVPTPHSIFKNTFKLEAGHVLNLSLISRDYAVFPYWQVREFYLRPKLKIEYEEAKQEVHRLLKSAFNYRMVADVPVGIFLSGGYDSTAVVAILQTAVTDKLKTFTIGFQEGNNEAPYAKKTASFFGTDHHEYLCTSKEAKDIIPALPYYFDEPFADSSAIPTILVSRFAREFVTVGLSADAGDEIFGGYNSYESLKAKTDILNYIPGLAKGIIGKILATSYHLVPGNNVELKHKLYSVSEALDKDKIKQGASMFHLMASLPKIYEKGLLRNKIRKYDGSLNLLSTQGFKSEIEWAMCADYYNYLEGDILTKVDRATMSASLEGREPFLDHRLVEFTATLPMQFKFDGKVRKKILKDIVHEYIPENMMERKKTGFSLPIHKWLREDLSFLIDENLSRRELAISGLLNDTFIETQVTLFKKNKLHYFTLIWKLLMFQMWYKKWMV
jgi:asparagine synthase (glutamine-hydrolysing)